ncbi:unknown [Fusobacterium sp. CAG:439]|nr:unknown [Fusobacterium sp. CAG:439]
MTFLAIDAQKNLFTLQKSQLQFEQTLVMSRANYITKQMGYRAQELEETDTDPDDDATYIALQQQESYLETRQDSLDSQISLMENEISSLKNLVNNNIKTSCSLNLIGS